MAHMLTMLLTIAIDPFVGLFRQPSAQAVAWALLQFVWQGAAIGAVTALALFVLRRGGADVRYVVASIGMALMLTLPIVTGVQKYEALTAHGVLAAPPQDTVSDPACGPARVSCKNQDLSRALAGGAWARTGAAPVADAQPFGPALMLLWLAGVAVLSARLLGGWIWMQRMRTHGVRAVEPAWERILTQLSRRLHITRTIALFESTRVDVPTVIGWLKPVVLLPASAVTALSPAQLEAILAHELAHIRRHDYLVNLLQTLVETLLFYHPAVWWVSRRIRVERENCCDDLAVSLCGDPVAYANALADLESLRSSIPPFRRLDRTAVAATGGSLLQRVHRLLGAPAAHSGVRPAWLAGSAALLIVASITLGADGVAAPAAVRHQEPIASPHIAQTAVQPAQDPRPTVATTRSATRTTAIAVPTADATSPVTATTSVVQTIPASPRSSNEAVTAAPAPVAASTVVLSSGPAIAVATSVATTGVSAAPQSSTHSSSNESHGNWSWSNDGERLQADYNGSFEFTDDDTDVRQMSPGGRLRISDGQWQGMVGRMLATPGHLVEITEHNGQIAHRYFVNGSERPFEPEGRTWLRQNLPKFVRNTGIDAPARVARLLKSGGVSAVLAEIDRVDGNYARGIYYRELFKQATLSPDQYRQVLVQASAEMKGSNYELSQLLISLIDRLPNDESSRAAYFTAASSLTGAYETGRVYSAMLKKGSASPQVVGGILDHLRTLHSDYEVSQLLLQIIAQQPLDGRNAASLLDVVAGMRGDYERGLVLRAFLKQNSIEGSLRAPFFRAVESVRGAYERSQILLAVVGRTDASRDTLKQAIQASRGMGAYETSQVLLAVAKAQPITGDLRDAYIDAAERLGAYEQGQVMTALVRSERRR